MFAVLLVGAAIACAGGPARAQGDDSSFSLTTGFDFSSGNYGGNLDTTILYIPLTGRYEIARWAFEGTLPYILIKGPGTVVGGTDTPIPIGGTASTTSTKSGIGDVVLGATYAVPLRIPKPPLVELTGKVKFPTADEDDGLGTGEFDFTVQVDLSKTYGKVTPFGTVGYQYLGDPGGGIDLDNVFFFSLGAGYDLSHETSAGLILDYREAAARNVHDPVELTPYLAWKASGRWSVNAYLLFGLSSGSPDHGGGIQLTATW